MILLPAVGGGRELIALSELGYKVNAFECVPSLVDVAQVFIQDNQLPATIQFAEPNEVPQGLAIHDGIILGWGAYMHMQGRDNRIAFLKKLRPHLEKGSPILISFAARDAHDRFYKIIYQVASLARRLRFSELPELGDTLPNTFDHYSTKDEIRQEMLEGSFEMIYYSTEGYAHAVGIAI